MNWQILSYSVKMDELPQHRYRILGMRSAPAGFHTATLFFGDSLPTLGSVVTNIYGATNVYARWPAAEFHEVYKLLRDEEPVFLKYEYPSGGPPGERPLHWISISTGQEPTGEGPGELEALAGLFAANGGDG